MSEVRPPEGTSSCHLHRQRCASCGRPWCATLSMLNKPCPFCASPLVGRPQPRARVVGDRVSLRHSDRRVLEALADDDRRFVTLELLYAELQTLTIRQIQGALGRLRTQGYATGKRSYAATGLGQAVLQELRGAENAGADALLSRAQLAAADLAERSAPVRGATS